MRYEAENEDDVFEWRNDKKILRDGARLRVPLQMRDSLRQARITDGLGGTNLHRPGFRVGDRSLHDAKQAAYDAYETEMQNAWRNPTGTQTGAGSPMGEREGDICTIDGYPGHLLRGPDGKLTCIPDKTRQRAMGAKPNDQGLGDPVEDKLLEIEQALRARSHDDGAIGAYLDRLAAEEDDRRILNMAVGDWVRAFEMARQRNPDLERAQSDSGRNHQQRMSRIYADYDRTLQDAWRGQK
jgi:hypothetical protein